MIRNPYNLSDLDAMALVYYADLEQHMQLNTRVGKCTVPELQPLMNYLSGRIKGIVTMRPADLENEQVVLHQKFQQAVTDYVATGARILNAKGKVITAKKKKITRQTKIWTAEINAIFDYDYSDNCFTVVDTRQLAYRHAQRLQMNTCPYCNVNFTYTIKTSRMKSRPEFDHFLKKSTYPFFALSFFNLIPSCSLCNSGALKGIKPFSIKTHLHPFIDDIEGLYQFRTNIDAVDFLVDGKDFDVTIQACKNTTKQQRDRAAASIGVFGIDDRYKFHKDIAGDVIKKAYVYNKTALENLFEGFQVKGKSIFSSKSEIKELVMSNYLHPDRFHKRVLSKLTKDIAEEFGLAI